ncbi:MULTISPECIES: hypothetical protein [Methanobacterium]|jgi:hypothetical protein|uniref:Uncharacterized protein n=1 Tax=Methanobacterium veterum TaxID=408577 RepID=A0A9E5DM72_9EURY|nr:MULTISPECIES: hypothetical protein [Methanobacterium]MCZ3366221.1 hypothetical protein [Methanobacterium veterum]MCZ3371551.1 hypothetical protein [Methanobacterium veterum]
MAVKNYFSIFFTNEPWKLDGEERKIHILLNVVLGIPILYLLSYIFANLMKLHYLPFFFALCFFLIAWIFYVYYWDQLDSKYGLKPFQSPFPYSYQGYIILFTLSAPAFFFLMLALGLTSGNFWFGLGGAVALVYPILGMFFRIKTFSDDSILIPKGKAVLPDKVVLPDGKELSSGEGRVVTETVKGFGFMPLSYWILASAVGLYTVGRGFSGIQLHFTSGTPPLEAAIFTIILGLLLQTVYLFPDKLNRIVPIELRTKKGFLFMFVLAFVLFGVSQFLIGIVTL